jgi:hypothetical protein
LLVAGVALVLPAVLGGRWHVNGYILSILIVSPFPSLTPPSFTHRNPPSCSTSSQTLGKNPHLLSTSSPPSC